MIERITPRDWREIDELMSVIKPDAVTSVGEYVSYETLELQEFFLRHVILLILL
jgi:hypothetical protein